jgi:hypothetical protein
MYSSLTATPRLAGLHQLASATSSSSGVSSSSSHRNGGGGNIHTNRDVLLDELCIADDDGEASAVH